MKKFVVAILCAFLCSALAANIEFIEDERFQHYDLDVIIPAMKCQISVADETLTRSAAGELWQWQRPYFVEIVEGLVRCKSLDERFHNRCAYHEMLEYGSGRSTMFFRMYNIDGRLADKLAQAIAKRCVSPELWTFAD